MLRHNSQLSSCSLVEYTPLHLYHISIDKIQDELLAQKNKSDKSQEQAKQGANFRKCVFISG